MCRSRALPESQIPLNCSCSCEASRRSLGTGCAAQLVRMGGIHGDINGDTFLGVGLQRGWRIVIRCDATPTVILDHITPTL
jgi:hypothetical protein